MQTLKTDAVVLGAGPGGYVAAIRLAQLGRKTLVVERERPGGVCLNVGCIPSKALISAAKLFDRARAGEAFGLTGTAALGFDLARAQTWKDEVVAKLTGGVKQLVKANGADYWTGEARFVAPRTLEVAHKEGPRRVEADHVVIATGSRPIELPGFVPDGQQLLDSTGALALREVPARLVVLGGGYIGLELGTVYAKLGAQVTVVEMTPHLLPGTDPELVQVVQRKLKKLGVELLLEARALGWERAGAAAALAVEVKGGERRTLEADRILVTVGRRPNTDRLGLELAGVEVDRRGFIPVDRRQRTRAAGVYAIGDCCPGPMLAHKASKEGEVVAEVIAGRPAEMDARAIPAVIFTDPEIATCGLDEAAAAAAGREVKVAKFPFGAIGRALTTGESDGFVKLVHDARTQHLLGAGIVGAGASDLISEVALAIEMGAVVADLALTVHPHPTLPEAIAEAAKLALGEPLHVAPAPRRRAAP